MFFKMFLLIGTLISHLLACDIAKNDPTTKLNSDCNYAGTCVEDFFDPSLHTCDCCKHLFSYICGDHWTCDENNPSYHCITFGGESCTEVQRYVFVSFGFRVDERDENEPSDIYCNTDPYERAVNRKREAPSLFFHEQVQYIAAEFGWPAAVYSAPVCDTCSKAHPCTLGVDRNLNVTQGYTFAFQADFNEYYDMSCGTPGIYLSTSEVVDCDANFDYGQAAHRKWVSVVGDLQRDSKFIDALNNLLESNAAENNNFLGLGWKNSVLLGMAEQITQESVKDVYITQAPTLNPTEVPTLLPTPIPTRMPTNFPTAIPTRMPTNFPTDTPTVLPTDIPTQMPSPIPTRMPTNFPTVSPTDMPTQTPTLQPTHIPTRIPTNSPTDAPTVLPTDTPTQMPSSTPTQTPTLQPTHIPTRMPTTTCEPYTDNVEDLQFQGVGSNCRAGLNSSWPGGATCESPYILCLPRENTAASFGGQSYKSSTYRYSVSECMQECANDQRCLGAEFVADPNSSVGDCNLIDDIPLEITSRVSGFNYDPATPYANLDHSATYGNALCFAKKDYCLHYFEAVQLNEVMLNCYCPNNRKGSYTKKVKRTVENTRFCGSDAAVEIRIQKAQANRMFHLCENWCLFNTDDPEAESWYWDPWKSCWREQYAGDAHRTYCNRVIGSPDTIEMQFVNHRTSLFCQI